MIDSDVMNSETPKASRIPFIFQIIGKRAKAGTRNISPFNNAKTMDGMILSTL